MRYTRHQRIEAHLTSLAPNPQPQRNLRLAWFLCGTIFAVSLFGAIAMIVESIAWVRNKGTAPTPDLFHTLDVVIQWGLGLSAFGLVILIALHIRRIARSQ